MKKIIIPILIVFFVFLIYKTNEENLIDYMVLGDSISLGINSYGNKTYGYNDYLKKYLDSNNLMHKYNNYFSKMDYKIKDLTNDIINNKNVIYNDKTYNIKKELREADLLTLSIGMDEIVEILKKDNIEFNNIKEDLNNIINEMNNLLKTITEFSKSKIIIIGYYNPTNEYNKNIDRIFAYLESELNKISKKYSVEYIDIYNTIKKDKTYLPNINDYHLTSRGYLKISTEIIDKSKL